MVPILAITTRPGPGPGPIAINTEEIITRVLILDQIGPIRLIQISQPSDFVNWGPESSDFVNLPILRLGSISIVYQTLKDQSKMNIEGNLLMMGVPSHTNIEDRRPDPTDEGQVEVDRTYSHNQICIPQCRTYGTRLFCPCFTISIIFWFLC